MESKQIGGMIAGVIIIFIIVVFIIGVTFFVLSSSAPNSQEKEQPVRVNPVDISIQPKEEIKVESFCDCNFDKYNCDDFSSKSEAQDCFDSCVTDVHKLDRDKDGQACETLS